MAPPEGFSNLRSRLRRGISRRDGQRRRVTFAQVGVILKPNYMTVTHGQIGQLADPLLPQRCPTRFVGHVPLDPSPGGLVQTIAPMGGPLCHRTLSRCEDVTHTTWRAWGTLSSVERLLDMYAADLANERTPSTSDDVHFTRAFVRAVLEEFSSPGDVVLDPFAGYGTTLLVGKEIGRQPIGVELLPERVVRRSVPALVRSAG